MKELQAKLKADAVSELTALITEGSKALAKITNTVDGTDRYSLARLIVGGRTASMEKAVLSRMVKAKGVKLLEQYNKQLDLPLSEDEEKKKGRRDNQRRTQAAAAELSVD